MTASPGTTTGANVRSIIDRLLGYYEGCLRAEEAAHRRAWEQRGPGPRAGPLAAR